MNCEKLYITGFSILNLVFYSQSDYRLPNYFKPTHYKILLDPNLAEGTFEGEVNVKFEILNATNKIELHATNMELHHLETVIKKESNEIEPLDLLLEDELLIINFDDNLHPGQYEMTLKYYGDLNDERRGFYRDFYRNDRKEKIFYAATLFKTTYARRAFPCWDEPAFKATFSIAICHFSNYTALSNMPALNNSAKQCGNGKILTEFEETPLLSTYALGFTISDFKEISNNQNFSIWTRKDVPENLIEFGRKVGVKAFEMKEFSSQYGLPKLDLFIIPDYDIPAGENFGLIIIRERHFFTNNRSVRRKFEKVGGLICQEVLHQQIGNLVSPAWWSDLWITEGLSKYYESFLLDKMNLSEFSNSTQSYIHSNQWQVYQSETDPNCPALYRNITDARNIFLTSPTLYYKGPMLFKMLSDIITKPVFHSGIEKILKKYQFKSITTNQFLDEMQESVSKSTFFTMNDGTFDVRAFMTPYITQVGYPVVTVVRDNATETVKLTQECLLCLENNSTDKKWPIPITYTTQKSPNFEIQKTIYWLNPSMKELVINNVSSNQWIIFNLQLSGYYRVNYDTDTWIQIKEYMNSENFTNIHPINRIQLLEDASWLFEKKKMSASMFYNLLHYLNRERDAFIWNYIPDIIIRIMLYVDKNIKDIYKNIVSSITTEMGDKERENTDISLLEYCFENEEKCRSVFRM